MVKCSLPVSATEAVHVPHRFKKNRLCPEETSLNGTRKPTWLVTKFHINKIQVNYVMLVFLTFVSNILFSYFVKDLSNWINNLNKNAFQ